MKEKKTSRVPSEVESKQRYSKESQYHAVLFIETMVLSLAVFEILNRSNLVDVPNHPGTAAIIYGLLFLISAYIAPTIERYRQYASNSLSELSNKKNRQVSAEMLEELFSEREGSMINEIFIHKIDLALDECKKFADALNSFINGTVKNRAAALDAILTQKSIYQERVAKLNVDYTPSDVTPHFIGEITTESELEADLEIMSTYRRYLLELRAETAGGTQAKKNSLELNESDDGYEDDEDIFLDAYQRLNKYSE